MSLQPMYPGQPNSPQTELAADITADDTAIPLLNASALPPAPNLAVIGTDETAETVLYTGVEGNNLTGVTRGFQGPVKAWNAGTKVARNFTAYDYDALRQNVEEVAGDIADVQGDVASLQSEVDNLANDITDIRADIGDMSTVPTTSKVVAGAISELFQSVSDGKTLIAGAITDKGVPTSPGDTFAQMAANIGAIETGGPWFGDWGAYTTVYDWSGASVSVPAQSWHTFLDITGEGWLTFLNIMSSASIDGPIRITIDGVQYSFQGQNIIINAGYVISTPIYFSTSIKIEVFNNLSSQFNIGCDYTYLLKTAQPDPSKQSILLASVRRGTRSQTTSLAFTDIVNISGSGYLLGIEVFGFYNSAASNVRISMDVNGVNKINNRTMLNTQSGQQIVSLLRGPIRFTNGLLIRGALSPTGSTGVFRVTYMLD